MKKRIMAWLLALVMTLSLMPMAGFADGGEQSSITVYFSLSDEGEYKTGSSGQKIAYLPVTLDYFDLGDYGLGDYSRKDEQGSVIQQPTVLHLFIKLLEQEYLGGEKLTVGGDALTVQGAAGSMYMKKFWGHDENLIYFVNGSYPIMTGSIGATADWILLEDGDVVDVAMFDDWSFYTDEYAGFRYFMDGDATTHSYTAKAGEATSISCRTAHVDMMDPSGTEYLPCGIQTIRYSQEPFDAEAASVQTDANGAAEITFPTAGTWYLWSNGTVGKSNPNAIVNSAAYAVVTVEEGGGVTTPKLTLTMDKASAVWSEKVTVTATNEKDEPVVCNWTVNDPSVTLYSSRYSWDEQTSVSIKGTEVKNGIVLTATSVDDPTLQAELRFDVLPLAEVYAVFDDGSKQPLTLKEETKAVGNGTFKVIEIPADADHIMVRPAEGYDITDGSGPETNTPLWTPEYNDEGYCAVTRAEGDLEKTTFAPERILFTRAVQPKYPASEWFCSRINVAKNDTIYLAWELSADSPIQEIKAENATFYTPMRLTQSSFRMLLDRNAEEAAFLFAVDAVKVYLTDEQYKTEGTALEQRDGFYVLPVKASDMEPNAKLPILMEKTYYVVAESTTGRRLRINVQVNQRDNTMDTPTAVEEYLCLASQYTNNANSVTGTYGTMPERTLAGYPQVGTGMNMIASLGNFGGYITYRFDQLITNDPNHPYGVDFVVRGNGYGSSGFDEPANVLVSQDGETWYTLAGSDHYSNHAYWDYTMVYTKSTGTSTVYGGASGTAADWTDSMGYSGTSYLYPNKDLYPLFPWTEENDTSITVTGTLLGGEGTTPEEIFDVATPKWGYVDTCYKGLNPYTGGEGGEVFDLDWAVDENGQPVELDWVKYVKVQTASNVDGGSIGEKSTEVSAIYKTEAAEAAVGVTAAPTSITINGQRLALQDGVQVYTAVAEEAVDVAVEASEGANVYINELYGTSAQFTALNHRMVRVVVQEGEKEPVIYYVNLQTQAQADEAAAKAVEALIDAIGDVTLDSGEAIQAARDAYDALTDGQKELVGNYQTLLDAEAAYAQLLAEQADRDAAKAVEKLIDAIGDVTLDSEEAIRAARDAYDTLTDGQKELVGNYQTLLDAEAKLAQLKKDAEKPSQPEQPEKPGDGSGKPATGDTGVLCYAVLAALTLLGGAAVLGKKRRID